jgi:hypothetical protein
VFSGVDVAHLPVSCYIHAPSGILGEPGGRHLCIKRDAADQDLQETSNSASVGLVFEKAGAEIDVTRRRYRSGEFVVPGTKRRRADTCWSKARAIMTEAQREYQ